MCWKHGALEDEHRKPELGKITTHTQCKLFYMWSPDFHSDLVFQKGKALSKYHYWLSVFRVTDIACRKLMSVGKKSYVQQH